MSGMVGLNMTVHWVSGVKVNESTILPIKMSNNWGPTARVGSKNVVFRAILSGPAHAILCVLPERPTGTVFEEGLLGLFAHAKPSTIILAKKTSLIDFFSMIFHLAKLFL